MKRIKMNSVKAKAWFLIVAIGVIGSFSSCEGPMGPMGPEGPSGEDTWAVFDMTVKKGDWIKDAKNGVFFYKFTDSRLTQFIVENGLVHAELVSNGVYYPLPLTEYYYDERYIAETVSFMYGIGWIEFSIGANDLFDEAGEAYQPETHLFKVSLLW